MKKGVALALTLAALWSVFQRIWLRALDGSDEPWGLLSLALLILTLRKTSLKGSLPAATLLPGALALLTFAGCQFYLSPLARGVPAMLALALMLSRISRGRILCPGILGLCLLGLPLMASLQFFLGYPLRSIVAQLVAFLLRLSGEGVIAQGVSLSTDTQQVHIDAACAGLKMLWTGGVTTAFLLSLRQMSMSRGAGIYALALGILVVANILRGAALFHLELGRFHALWGEHGQALHSAVGLILFAASLSVIIVFLGPAQRKPAGV